MTLPRALPTPSGARPHVLMLGTSPEMRGGVAAVVATLRDAGLFERANVQYLSTHVDGGRLHKARHFVGAAAAAIRILRSGRVSVVHAHVSAYGSFWRKATLLWIARRFGVATICHLHDGRFGVFADTGIGGPVLRWCIRCTLESSTAVVVLSAPLRDWVHDFAPRARVRLIGNPVRCPDHSATIVAHGHERPGRILFLGKVGAEKGAFDLLEAFARFVVEHPAWRLVVAGNGEIDQFLAQAEALGIRAQIDCLGWVSGVDKERALSSADIFALPSYSEGMPVSVLEAMAYGSAVVTTPVGGVPDMMQPQVHGLWVNPGDVDGLAECLMRLASSAALRASLGAAARQHVLGNFSVERVMSQICETYDEAAARSPR